MGEWKRNIWTGSDILNVTRTARIIRHGLYRAEEWGDYSLAFPIHGPWRKTLSEAKRDIKSLQKKALPVGDR